MAHTFGCSSEVTPPMISIRKVWQNVFRCAICLARAMGIHWGTHLVHVCRATVVCNRDMNSVVAGI